MSPVKYRVTRDVSKDEKYNWLGRAVTEGETFDAFTGCTYGSCNEEVEVALDDNGAFFGFPLDAVEQL